MDTRQIHKKIEPVMQEASRIALEYFETTDLQADHKADGNKGISVVTEADQKLDEFLTTELSKLFPDFGFITEEVGISNPSHSNQSPEYSFIIDPIDGTTNLSVGNKNWGISVAIFKKDKPIYGYISYPALATEIYTLEEEVFLNNVLIQKPEGEINLANRHIIILDGPATKDFYDRFVDYILENKNTFRRFGSTIFAGLEVLRGNSPCLVVADNRIWDFGAVWAVAEKLGYEVRFLSKEPSVQKIEDKYDLVIGRKELVASYLGE